MHKATLLGSLLVASCFMVAHADEFRTISVTGHGEVESEPDTAIVRMSVVANNTSLILAKQAADQNFAALREAIRSLDIDSVNVRATPHSIDRKYETINDVPSAVGYEVRRFLSVTLKDTKSVPAFLDAVISAGANDVSQIVFVSSRERELREESLKIAIADSKIRAAVIAEGFGARIGKVLKVELGQGGSLGGAMYSVDIVEKQPDRPPTIKIDSTIDVVFELID